jgi:large repetitive protein
MRLKERLTKRWSRLILVSLCALALLLPAAAAWAAPCDIKNNAPPLIWHDLSASYCELCSYGYITVVVANPYEGVDMTAMTVVEDLRSSGLTFHASAPDAVRYSVNGGPLQIGAAPAVSGTNGSVLTWTAAQIPALGRLVYRPFNLIGTITITFAVSRASGLSEEGLVSADRRIEARLTYTTDAACFAGTTTVVTGLNTLPLQEPWPTVNKRGATPMRARQRDNTVQRSTAMSTTM